MASLRSAALVTLLLLPLAAIAAWLVVRAGVTRDDPADVLAALRAAHGPALPAAQAVGAAGPAELQSYDRETLYEYINGAAEAYIARGFERCVATTYRFAGAAGEFEVAADVYRFAAAGGAIGQAEAERPQGAAAVDALADVWSDGALLVAVRGRDLLKATALAQGSEAAAALEAIAAAWTGGR
jgi:hypothetical protein